ncbi:MAG TPA: 30S ribosomal protein S13 [Actinomycetota bacterium]|jgi:small subunit ribosomal protein S13|nr:30S ribosomal protein S13 [Actinomycetota bacterium]
MARIAGVDLPRGKRADIALTYIFGVGRRTAEGICTHASVNPSAKIQDLTDEEIARIRQWIDANLKVEGELRRQVQQDIRRKIEIGSYQGMRHVLGLPARGQRTQTNARTRKGPKRTVAGKKKKVGKKG